MMIPCLLSYVVAPSWGSYSIVVESLVVKPTEEPALQANPQAGIHEYTHTHMCTHKCNTHTPRYAGGTGTGVPVPYCISYYSIRSSNRHLVHTSLSAQTGTEYPPLRA